jgi:predicted nuclease with RNAse H fold
VLGEPASGVRDEFEQAAVGVAEVHARTLAARTVAPHRAKLDLESRVRAPAVAH